MLGFYTIPQGKRVAVWDMSGARRLVDGPRQIFAWRLRIEPLLPYVAGPNQYLAIRFRDGRTEHLQGPASVWLDPVEHESIAVAALVVLNANQSIGIYRQTSNGMTCRMLHGPARFMPAPEEWVRDFNSHLAEPDQYLIVKFRDGRVEHIAGPANIWFNPVEHEEITVAPAVVLDANEAVVVYRHQPAGIDRRVLRGPARFVPTADEWLHEFRWHGADPANPKRKIPRGLIFSKLRVIPDQMYFDVEDVRTADDALLTIKLMVFFELMDIDVMLDQTHDPVADFINAVTADVIDFVAAGTFEQFKERTETMNELASYKQLAQRAGRIGYRINKVVYRGYQATAKLQAMHDGAIESRTRLKLEAETESQAQDLADLKLGRERERTAQRQLMQQTEAEHEQKLTRMKHEESLRQQAAAAAAALQAQRDRQTQATRFSAERYAGRIDFLKAVQAMEVDMTRYMVARHERPDKRIRVDGAAPRLNLHERS